MLNIKAGTHMSPEIRSLGLNDSEEKVSVDVFLSEAAFVDIGPAEQRVKEARTVPSAIKNTDDFPVPVN
jgi:hypothetical protein